MFIPLRFHLPVQKKHVFVRGEQIGILCDQDVSFAVEVERVIDQITNVFLERLKCHTASFVDSTLYYP